MKSVCFTSSCISRNGAHGGSSVRLCEKFMYALFHKKGREKTSHCWLSMKFWTSEWAPRGYSAGFELCLYLCFFHQYMSPLFRARFAQAQMFGLFMNGHNVEKITANAWLLIKTSRNAMLYFGFSVLCDAPPHRGEAKHFASFFG